ncbi:hypothetical protein AAG570_011043 [Ranatra chinensis]|uniref:Mononegavirus-type SAM-dependent 2'-O-MTase domain-containing protein n=1 Tax=Ranatra chinensis TaxID=642074 RepID=A0ABD0YJH0_9HEMI
MFTLFECASLCLLYLLSCCFKRVIVFKPVTSRPGNSECYVVCLDFWGPATITPAQLSAMLERFEDDSMADRVIFSRSHLPSSFIVQAVECAAFFKNFQVSCFKEGISIQTVPGLVLTNCQ